MQYSTGFYQYRRYSFTLQDCTRTEDILVHYRIVTSFLDIGNRNYIKLGVCKTNLVKIRCTRPNFIFFRRKKIFYPKKFTLTSPIIKTIILLICFLKLQSFETTKLKTWGNRADDFWTNEFRSGKKNIFPLIGRMS